MGHFFSKVARHHPALPERSTRSTFSQSGKDLLFGFEGPISKERTYSSTVSTSSHRFFDNLDVVRVLSDAWPALGL
jgi:hypothetical protein